MENETGKRSIKSRLMKQAKRKELEKMIKTWNNERLALYHLTTPNDNLEYYGIIRIYYQDSDSNTISKCCRVSSAANTQEIIQLAMEKYQIKPTKNFYLVETHDNGEHRQLDDNDHPLEIQLSWCEDGREGKFFLCQAKEYTTFVRNCTEGKLVTDSYSSAQNTKLPPFMVISDSAFTRTISDRNKVIERQRQKMVNKKLVQSKKNASSDNLSNSSQPSIGTIKVFATSLFPEAPYKTVIVSAEDTVESVMKEALDKFALSGMVANANDCHMVVVVISNNHALNSNLKSFRRDTQEFALAFTDKPLQFYHHLQQNYQTIMFHIRKTVKLESVKSVDSDSYHLTTPPTTGISGPTIKQPKPPTSTTRRNAYHVILRLCSTSDRNIPYNINSIPTCIVLEKDIAIFGTNKKLMKERVYLGQNPTKLVLFPQHTGTTILPIHCIVSTLDSVLTVVPCVMDADVRINNEKIYDKVIVHESSRLTLGNNYCYDITINHPHFFNPNTDSQNHYSSIIPTFNGGDNENNSNTVAVPQNLSTDKDTMKQHSNPSSRSKQPTLKSILHSLQLEKYPALPLGHKYTFSKYKRVVESCISYVEPKGCDYKLEPAFVTYLTFCSLYEHLNPIYADDQGRCHPDSTYFQFVDQVTYAIHELFHVFKKSSDDVTKLVFWLSNTSQLYHFLSNDFFLQRTIPMMLLSTLGDSVKEMIKNISLILQQELDYILPSLFDVNRGYGFKQEEIDRLINSDIDSSVHSFDNKASFMIGSFLRISKRQPTIGDIFVSFNSWISLFYYMKLNTSYTVQLFQRIFGYCNEWLVSRLCGDDSASIYVATNNKLHPTLSTAIDHTCTSAKTIGFVINSKIAYFRLWAEAQGLEEAFDDQLRGAYELLDVIKKIDTNKADDIFDELKFVPVAHLKCFLKLLLTNPDNPTVLINRILNKFNPNNNDSLSNPIQNNNNNHILLIAEDDYYSHKNENITLCIRNFLQPLILEGITVLVVNSDPNANWESRFEANIPTDKRICSSAATSSCRSSANEHLSRTISTTAYDDDNSEITIFQLNKPINQSLGIHIVAVQDESSTRNSSIFIKSIVEGLLADKCGRFHVGDQLLSVNDWPLSGLSVAEVVNRIKECEPTLKFKTIKSSAQSQGIMGLIADTPSSSSPEQNYSSQPESFSTVSTTESSSGLVSFPEPPDDLFDEEPHYHTPFENLGTSSGVSSNGRSGDENLPSHGRLRFNDSTTGSDNKRTRANSSLSSQSSNDMRHGGGWVCMETAPSDLVDSAYKSSSSQL